MARRPRPELLSLLAACKDSPKEDAPRLVLADWLAEHGDEHDAARAEFIRLQLSWPPKDESLEYEAHRQRVEQLREHYEQAWYGPLAGLLSEGGQRGDGRGLVNL